MGYSNVAGDINVLSTTSTQNLTVRGDTVLYGNLTASAGFHNFGNVTAANLTVTGNFTITATNTQVTNALSINNAGTSTALKVVQYDVGTQNVAEFYDYNTLAMVIDPYGNVGIHATSSPGYRLTVGDGSYLTTVTSQLYMGNGSGLSNLNSSNLVNPLTSLQLSNTQSNITSLGTLVNLNVSGTANIATGFFTTANVTGGLGANTAFFNILRTNVSNTGALNASNASVSNLLCSNLNVVTTANMTALTVTGILSAGLYIGNASGLSNLNSSNLVGNVEAANVASSVTNPAQPNITSVGILSSLTVGGILQAGLYSGNASGLSNLNSSNLVGNVASANAALVVTQPSQPNITSVGTLTGLTVSGILQADLYSGNASGLSNLNSSNLVGNVASANAALVVTQPSQPNITSVGTLTGLTVSGILQADLYSGNASGLSNLNSSNLVGNVASANAALVVTQPSQPNITSVGTLTGLTVSGILQADLYSGNASGLSNLNSSNLVGNVASANVALVVSQPAQPNITSVGTLTGLTVGGILQAGLHTGNASGLSNLNSSNLVGNVASANVALVVSQPAQPNITSVGTLTGLTVSGILQAGLYSGNASGLSNLNSSNLVGNVASANAALVVTQPSQPNITSVGVLTSLNVSGISNISTLNVSGFANLSTLNTASINVANIYTTNIVGFVGSQWTGTVGQPIYYLSNVGIGTSTVTANLQVAGNLVVSNAITTSNLILTGNSNVLGYSNLVTANVQTLNVATPIPITTGLFMNLNATYTLNSTGNWTGNIASTITSNLYTLFAPNPVASWTTYGSNPLVTGPTANGGFKFSQTGPWAFTAVITADQNIKTLALSANTSDVHSNLADTGVWQYCYRIGVGQDPSVPITIPFYVDNTNKYYFLDIESTNQVDNIHRTAYTNTTAEAYTGSYVILKPL